MHRVFVIVSLLCLSTAAWAQDVEVEFSSAGGTNVTVTLFAEQGGQVTIPSGTIISTEEMDDQRLLIGQTIEQTLEAGERATMVVQAYCIDYDRPSPSAGESMRRLAVARGDLSRLLSVAGAASHATIQDAIWALSSAARHAGPEARALLDTAGLTPKNDGLEAPLE